MDIRRYTAKDEKALFALLRGEGDEWEEYFGRADRERYARALRECLTYVAVEDAALCGFVRCREDFGFGIYVYDLLVSKECRGSGVGRKLMEQVFIDYPGQALYVMSDVDGYYAKLGYAKIGSVFEVTPREQR